MQSFWIPFLSIAIAELGDKTQIAVMLLSAKTSRRLELFLGTMLGFLVVDGLAVAAGSWMTRFIPLFWIKIVSGIIFIVFGILTLKAPREDTDEEKTNFKNPFLLGFGAIFLAELGDKTQIASGLFAAKYAWPGVLAGALTALALLSWMAIYAGQWLTQKVKPSVIKKVAGILFIIIGCSFFFF